MAYGYGRTNKPIDVTEFLIKRWANLYPLYIVTVLAGASRLVSLLLWLTSLAPRCPSLGRLFLTTHRIHETGYLLIPQRQPQPLGLLVILLLGLSGFVPSAFINDINTPGWTIGSLFVLYAVRSSPLPPLLLSRHST